MFRRDYAQVAYCLVAQLGAYPETEMTTKLSEALTKLSMGQDRPVQETVRPMRILFVSLDVPFPVTSGRRLRNWALLRAFAEEGHQVTMVCFDEPGASCEVPFELREVCRNVDVVSAPDHSDGSGRANWNRIQALSSPLPYGAWRLRSLRFQAKVKEWFAREEFDALICDDIYMAANVPVGPGVPMLLNKHGVGTVVLERYLANERNPLKKMYGRIELLKTRWWEASVCNQSALIMACSEQDRREIERLSPGARVTIVPNVIEVPQYERALDVNTHTVVFVAYMGWYPNQDAVEFFAAHILPKLRNFVPDVKFVVAGRNPPETFRNRLSRVPGVEFTGTLPDIRPAVAAAAVCVVPLRIGTGTRLKILEAAAMEKAVVSTRIGAEGLDFADGTEIILADDPETFAREVAALLNSPERRRALGIAARQRVQRQYSMPALRVALRQTIETIAGQVGTRSRPAGHERSMNAVDRI